MIALVLAAALVGGGCDIDGGGSSGGGGSAGARETTPSPTTTDAPGAQATEESAAPALASRESTLDKVPVRLDIIELRRTGGTVALSLRLTRPGADEDASGAQVASTFDNGEFEGEGIRNGSTLDGISLIDTKNRKRYLVARDSGGDCVCDGDLGSSFVRPNAPLVLSATFGAPPPDVRAVDVVIPDFGTFKDVPLS